MRFCRLTINLCWCTIHGETRCDETIMECSKVRQAMVFLAQQPTETEVNKRRTNEF